MKRMRLLFCHLSPEAEHISFVMIHYMQRKYLVNGPVSREVILSFLDKIGESTGSGGHSLFLGQVRADVLGGKIVRAIEYSAYESMVETEANKIIVSVLNEFPDVKSIDILHSDGQVKTGEISLFVLISAGHRRQAMDACSKTVDLIKDRLPVWKKEIYEDDSHAWK
jgi:molybdopterin synthase catalytic subunit